MMRVAHVVRRFTFDEWGGTENVVWHSALTQHRMGVDAEILATSALSTPGEELREGIRIRRFGYFYPYFPMPEKDRTELDKKGGNPYAPKLRKCLMQENFDLIHVHSGGRVAQMCLEVARKKNIPCVITIHGGAVDVPPEEMRQMLAPTRRKLRYGGILDRLFGRRRDAITNMDAIICVNRSEAQALQERVHGGRVVYMPNGVDVEAFAKSPKLPAPLRSTWGIPENRRLLLSVSRIDYQKNQAILVELTARITQDGGDVHLLLIGPITAEWYRQKLIDTAKILGVAERVTLIPGLPPEDPRLVAALHEADLFILPSLHEPFGIVVLEAWAAGTPVIASTAGGLKGFIEPGQNGMMFDPQDLDALYREYRKFEEDPTLAERLSARAGETVKNYSWATLTEDQLRLYRELINGL